MKRFLVIFFIIGALLQNLEVFKFILTSIVLTIVLAVVYLIIFPSFLSSEKTERNNIYLSILALLSLNNGILITAVGMEIYKSLAMFVFFAGLTQLLSSYLMLVCFDVLEKQKFEISKKIKNIVIISICLLQYVMLYFTVWYSFKMKILSPDVVMFGSLTILIPVSILTAVLCVFFKNNLHPNITKNGQNQNIIEDIKNFGSDLNVNNQENNIVSQLDYEVVPEQPVILEDIQAEQVDVPQIKTNSKQVSKSKSKSKTKSKSMQTKLQKLYIEMCTKSDLLLFEVFNEERASYIIKERENGNMWYDIDSFVQYFNLQPHEMIQIMNVIVFPPKPKAKYGRKIDI